MAKRSVSADINRPVSVTVTGGGVAATGGGGGGTLPGTITPTTGNTVTGNHHTHKMLPTHAALPDIGPDDHHAPVTVGNTGLSIAGQQVSLRLATVSGLEVSSGLMLADSIAGAGLAISSKVLSIDLATNSGLELSGSPAKLHLRTPSSVSTTSTNAVTDALGHMHAVVAYSDLATYPAHLAKADALGDSTWHRIDLTDRLRAPLIDTATGVGLSIAPDEDLSLSPVSGVVKATSGVAVGTDNYVSQTTGWRAGYNGGADFRYLYADELHAKSFITDLEQALAGGQIIAKSVAVVAQDFTVPATAAGGQLYVEDLPGAAGMPVFQENDWVRLRQFSRGSGSLTITYCTGAVGGYLDQGDGTQRWYFYRPGGGQGGTATAGTTIEKGTLALDYGVSGNGFYEVNAIDGAWAENSPYAQVATWSVHPANVAVRSRWGNLKGIFNVANEYGLYAGDGVTDASKFLRISSQTVEAHNLPIRMYDGASATIALDPAAPSFAMGATLPSAYGTGSGLWMGKDGGTYKFRVGAPTGAMLAWDGSHLDIKAGTNNYLRAAGTSLEFYANSLKVIDITNAPSVTIGHVATNKGNMYWNPSNSRLEFRGSTNGTVVQAYVDTSGAIVAGGGGVQIDAGGITLDNNDTLYATSKVKWADSGTAYAYVASQYQVNNQYLYLLSQAHGSGGIGYIVLYAQSYGGAVTESLTLQSNGFMGWSGELDVESDLAVGGGLNLGTATGAGTGEIKASGDITLGANNYSNYNLIFVNKYRTWNTGQAGYDYVIQDTTDGEDWLRIDGNNDWMALAGAGAGNVLIGTTSDDGVNRLQVNGPSIFGAWMAADRVMVREIAAPPAIAGWIQIFGDSADGDLKVRFPNGTIKTIQTN